MNLESEYMLEKECNSFSTRKAFLVPRIVSIRPEIENNTYNKRVNRIFSTRDCIFLPRVFQMEQHEDDGYDYGSGTNDDICYAEEIISSS